MKISEFELKFYRILSNHQYSIIGSDNGLRRPGDKPISEPMMAQLNDA